MLRNDQQKSSVQITNPCQVGFKRTGRRCRAENCRGALHDVVLDWDDALPVDKLYETGRLA